MKSPWWRMPTPGARDPGEPFLIAVPNLEPAPNDRGVTVNGLKERYAAIWALADSGATLEEMARATGQPIGQIELILGLSRQIDGGPRASPMHLMPELSWESLDPASRRCLERTRSAVLNLLVATGLFIAVSGGLLRWRTVHEAGIGSKSLHEKLMIGLLALAILSFLSRRLLGRRVRLKDPGTRVRSGSSGRIFSRPWSPRWQLRSVCSTDGSLSPGWNRSVRSGLSPWPLGSSLSPANMS